MSDKTLLLHVIVLGALVFAARVSEKPLRDSTTAMRSERGMALTLGINRSNLVWASGGDLSLQRQILDSMRRFGARRVRLALQLPYENAVAHVVYCNQLGITDNVLLPAFRQRLR